MKHILKIFLLSGLGVCSCLSFAGNAQDAEKKVMYDIGSMFSHTPSKQQVEVSDQGVYVEAKFCREDVTSLGVLLKDKLKIKQDQELIHLFNQMLCAPTNDKLNADLSAYATQIENPLNVDLVIYTGMQELGKWSLDNAQHLSDMPNNAVEISMLGINPKGVLPTVSFWQVLSPQHVRVWYGPFRMAPSDALIYDFKLTDEQWKLSKLWIISRF